MFIYSTMLFTFFKKMAHSLRHEHLKKFFTYLDTEEGQLKLLTEKIDMYYSNYHQSPPITPYIKGVQFGSCHIFVGGAPKKQGGPQFISLDFYPVRRMRFQVVSILHFSSFRNQSTPYPSLDGMDYSHLCGKSQCVNPSHVCLEPHRVNCQRRTCHKEKRCHGHSGYSDCIFSYRQRP